MLDDETMIKSYWTTATGIGAPTGEALDRLLEFTWAVARAALGLPRFASLPSGRAWGIRLSDELTSLPLDVIDDLWDEHQVRSTPTEPSAIHRFIFIMGLMERPDLSAELPLEAPAPETLEWLWRRGVSADVPGTGEALVRFVNGVLVKARRDFLAKDKSLVDWELSEALDGDIVATEDVWASTDGPDDAPPKVQVAFSRVVGWYLNPRMVSAGLTLGPTS